MAPPAWAALSRVTGDPRYVDYAIHEYLATRTDIASFDEAPWDQGGAGVTLVTLK